VTAPEHQDLALIERTLKNLNIIECQKHREGPFEVTQTINSFLSIIAHPRERLLDPEKINWMLLSDPKVVAASIPEMKSSWEYDQEEPRTLGHLLRLLRNGIAHGNVDVLDLRDVSRLRDDYEMPKNIAEDDIAGIEIWNSHQGRRTWGTVLTVEQMSQALRGFAALALDRELRSSPQRPKTGGRKPKPEPALRRDIPNAPRRRGDL
jgi:hypothetical protein